MSQQALICPPASSTLQLRYYQEDCLAALRAGIVAGNHSQLVVMATGLGKTVCFAKLIAEHDGAVLVVAHRDELIQQAQRTIEAATGEYVEIEQGLLESWKARVVVGSVQSLRRENRLGRLGRDRFSLVIVDEAHHATAASYRAVMDWFSCPVIGFTATPDRTDELALGEVFDSVSYSMDIQDGIEQGWLVPFQGHRVELEEVNLDMVGTSAGDLAAGALDEAMVKSVDGIVHGTKSISDGRQAIAFFPGVQSATLAAARYEREGIRACVVSGKTVPDERRMLIKDFRRGVYRILCNCQVATEGFDVPEVSCIIQGRPTLSRALYAQMIGRGARPLGGIVDSFPARDGAEGRRERIARSAKADCMIIDCVGNSTKHSLIGPEDALGGNFDEQVVALAKKTKKPGDSVLQSLKAAQIELARLTAKINAKVRATVKRFDPFGLLGVSAPEEDRYAQRFGRKPMSEGQRSVFQKLGMLDESTEGLSKAAASRMLDEVNRRRSMNLATYKQVRQLEKFGVQGSKDVSFERARAGLDYIAGKGWGKHAINPQELYTIVHGQRAAGED